MNSLLYVIGYCLLFKLLEMRSFHPDGKKNPMKLQLILENMRHTALVHLCAHQELANTLGGFKKVLAIPM